jgi:hypothetical protein
MLRSDRVAIFDAVQVRTYNLILVAYRRNIKWLELTDNRMRTGKTADRAK